MSRVLLVSAACPTCHLTLKKAANLRLVVDIFDQFLDEHPFTSIDFFMKRFPSFSWCTSERTFCISQLRCTKLVSNLLLSSSNFLSEGSSGSTRLEVASMSLEYSSLRRSSSRSSASFSSEMSMLLVGGLSLCSVCRRSREASR